MAKAAGLSADQAKQALQIAFFLIAIIASVWFFPAPAILAARAALSRALRLLGLHSSRRSDRLASARVNSI